jgi:hypothetical protein
MRLHKKIFEAVTVVFEVICKFTYTVMYMNTWYMDFEYSDQSVDYFYFTQEAQCHVIL